MISSGLIFLLFILSGTGGEIAIAYGIKATGEPERLRPKQLLIFLGRALRNVSFCRLLSFHKGEICSGNTLPFLSLITCFMIDERRG
jgi:hypothetical protein